MSDHIWTKCFFTYSKHFAVDIVTSLIENYLKIENTGKDLDYVKDQTEKVIDLLQEIKKVEHKKLKKELESNIKGRKW